MIGDLRNNDKISVLNNIKGQLICKVFKVTTMNTNVESACLFCNARTSVFCASVQTVCN